jgi:hypothetical protein
MGHIFLIKKGTTLAQVGADALCIPRGIQFTDDNREGMGYLKSECRFQKCMNDA